MNINDEIRDVYAELAQHAPPPDRLRAGIAGRAKAHRQRRLLITGGGALAVAGAVALPSWLLARGTGTTPKPDLALLDPDPVRGVPMPFSPAWVPEGFQPIQRRATISGPGHQFRRWAPGVGDLRSIDLYLNLTMNYTAGDDHLSEVDINETTGYQLADGGLFWQPRPGIYLHVNPSNLADPKATALRFARSAQIDRVDFVMPTLRFGWLPDSMTFPHSYQWTADGTEMVYADRGTSAAVTAAIVKHRTMMGGEVVPVRGTSGWFVGFGQPGESPPANVSTRAPDSGQGGGILAVPLANGTWLEIVNDLGLPGLILSRSDLIRIADTVHIGLG